MQEVTMLKFFVQINARQEWKNVGCGLCIRLFDKSIDARKKGSLQ